MDDLFWEYGVKDTILNMLVYTDAPTFSLAKAWAGANSVRRYEVVARPTGEWRAVSGPQKPLEDQSDLHAKLHGTNELLLLAIDIMEALGAPPEPVDWVGVVFKDFDSPAEAAKWAAAKPAKIYSYYAPQRMKLTIGDVVEVEDGSRPATVVELNAPHNSTLTYKKVLKRNE